MIPYVNCEIIASVIFFFVVKFFCAVVVWCRTMPKRHTTLTSIPERSESEDENSPVKWIPKKRHEVLKAKYKCLKKLFQIYDASLVGVLPAVQGQEIPINDQMVTKKRRKKRSHRTKCDACAGTTEITSGDVSQSESKETELPAAATPANIDLSLKSCISTQIEFDLCKNEFNASQDSKVTDNNGSQQECGCTQTIETMPVTRVIYKERPKSTRFQNFFNRIFGNRHERAQRHYVQSRSRMYATSDNSISLSYYHNYAQKRRRRGLRLRRAKKIQSEAAMHDVHDDYILTHLKSVRKSCLLDKTPRQCPIFGCHVISCGIIKNNDHINVCHFPERKHICYYCHEGFDNEYDKSIHENEHIGITKLGSNLSTHSASIKSANIKVSNTQTDPELSNCSVPEEKLKKIVSFFEKINDPDKYLMEIGRNRFSETKIQQCKNKIDGRADYISDSSRTETSVSCDNFPKLSRNREITAKHLMKTFDVYKNAKPSMSCCSFCGEQFKCGRQLNLHVDIQHRDTDKVHELPNRAPVVRKKQSNHMDVISEDGKIKVESIDKSNSMIGRTASSIFSLGSCTDIGRRKSTQSLTCSPSNTTSCCTSIEAVRKPSVVNNIVKKMRNGLNFYKWEPGTKIIHV